MLLNSKVLFDSNLQPIGHDVESNSDLVSIIISGDEDYNLTREQHWALQCLFEREATLEIVSLLGHDLNYGINSKIENYLKNTGVKALPQLTAFCKKIDQSSIRFVQMVRSNLGISYDPHLLGIKIARQLLRDMSNGIN